MSEYIVDLPTSGAADEFFKMRKMPNMTLYGYPLTGEITRCRDCKYRDIPDSNHCELLHCFIGDEDFFCAWGERRDA